MDDLIKRADAIKVLQQFAEDEKPTDEMSKQFQLYQRGRHLAFLQAVDEINALPSAETHEIRTETHGVCLISKDDAMGAVQDHFNANGFKGYDDGQKMMDRINALPSAKAEPIVIRAKTFMRKEDFDRFAEDIKRQGENIICIPCDAEVVSAEAVQGEWIWRTDIPIGGGRTSAGYICSNCGKDYWHGNVFNFCPNCGARMKGGAE